MKQEMSTASLETKSGAIEKKCGCQPAPDPSFKQALDGMLRTFEEFKTKNDERLKAVEKRRGDVLQEEQVDRISGAIDIQKDKMRKPLRLRMDATDIPESDACGPIMTQAAEMGCIAQTPPVETASSRIARLQRAQAARPPRYAARSQMNAVEQRRSQIRNEYRSAFNRYLKTGDDGHIRNLQTRAASVGTNPSGGYLAVPELDRTITRIVSEVSPIRQIATVREIAGNSFEKPWSNGGASSGWVGEAESRAETDTPTLTMLEFPTMELYAKPKATQSLLDDAYLDIEQWLADEVQIEFAEQEGAAFVNGNGNTQPRGFLNYTTVADASWVDGKLGFTVTGVAAALTDGTHKGVDSLLDLVYTIKAAYRQGSQFVMNRATEGAYRKIKDGNDQYLWQPGAQSGQPSSLIGYPITEAEDMPDIGAGTFPVAFGDFQRGYLIVDRIGVRVLRDPYSSKPFVEFYTTKRVGGGVQNFEALKLLKISA